MYTNLEQIQSGSFSTVYRAWCTTLTKHVALKVIPKEKYTETGIMNEFRIMELLGTKHPNICSMIDYYEDDNNYIIVLEYCECGDLYDFLDIVKRQGNVSHPAVIQLDIIKIIHQLFSALEYAHSLGIAHRDIKPENILLTKEGNIKVADWGHATLDKVSKDFNIGTDNYRAPETFGCLNGYNTIQCDAWAVGVTLLYLMSGQCPFRNAAISKNIDDVNNVDQDLNITTKKHVRCPNFQDFLQDRYGFLYRYFLKPIIYVHRGCQDNSSNGKPTLYVWQDMINIHQMFYFSRIIVDHLAGIDPDDRSMAKSLSLIDKVWNYKNFDNNVHDGSNFNDNSDMKGSMDNIEVERKQVISKSS